MPPGCRYLTDLSGCRTTYSPELVGAGTCLAQPANFHNYRGWQSACQADSQSEIAIRGPYRATPSQSRFGSRMAASGPFRRGNGHEGGASWPCRRDKHSQFAGHRPTFGVVGRGIRLRSLAHGLVLHDQRIIVAGSLRIRLMLSRKSRSGGCIGPLPHGRGSVAAWPQVGHFGVEIILRGGRHGRASGTNTARLLATDRPLGLSEEVFARARWCVTGSSITSVLEPPPSRFNASVT